MPHLSDCKYDMLLLWVEPVHIMAQEHIYVISLFVLHLKTVWYFTMPTRFGEKIKARLMQTCKILVFNFEVRYSNVHASLLAVPWRVELRRETEPSRLRGCEAW